MEGNYTAQRVSVIPTNNQQRFKEIQIKVPLRDRTLPEQRSFRQTSLSPRHAVKEIVVCLSRGPSPEKQTVRHTFFDEEDDKQKRLSSVDVSRKRYQNMFARLHVKPTLIPFCFFLSFD